MKKVFSYVAAFFAGVIAILAYIYKKPTPPADPHFDTLKKPIKEEIKEIDEKIEKVKKGVEKKDVEETIDYWEKN